MFHRTCYFASSPEAFKKKNMLSQGFRGSPIAHPGVRDWTPPCQSNEQAAVQQLLAAFVVALPFRRCRSRTCECRSAASRLPPPPQPANEPLRRRRVCKRSDCWLLVSPDCDSGFCSQHCRIASCSCTEAGPPGLEPRVSSTRRCRRCGCQGVVDVACLTAYCREHCTSRRCCVRLAHGRDEHPSWDLRQSSPVVHAPLRQYLSEMCSGIPEDVGQLPAHIRNSLEELREFASAGGRRNASGSRRHRHHRESRPT